MAARSHVNPGRNGPGDPAEEIVRLLGIRVTRALDGWRCLAALACQPFMPIISYEVMAELLAEHVRHEASHRDEDWQAFPTR